MSRISNMGAGIAKGLGWGFGIGLASVALAFAIPFVTAVVATVGTMSFTAAVAAAASTTWAATLTGAGITATGASAAWTFGFGTFLASAATAVVGGITGGVAGLFNLVKADSYPMAAQPVMPVRSMPAMQMSQSLSRAPTVAPQMVAPAPQPVVVSQRAPIAAAPVVTASAIDSTVAPRAPIRPQAAAVEQVEAAPQPQQKTWAERSAPVNAEAAVTPSTPTQTTQQDWSARVNTAPEQAVAGMVSR